MRSSSPFSRKPPQAEVLVLEAPFGASLESLATAGPELSERLAGATVRLGDTIAVGAVALVVRGATPDLPTRIGTRTPIQIRPQPRRREPGVDLSILLDASHSMGELDTYPTRYQAAVYAVHEFISRASDVVTRVEIAPFQRVTEPLAAFGDLGTAPLGDLSRITPRGPGNVVGALEAAFARFENLNTVRDRAILVVTDGDAYDLDFTGVAERARALRIMVHAIILGGDDVPALARVAEMSGGVYVEAVDETELSLKPVLERLASHLDVPLDWPDTDSPAVAAGQSGNPREGDKDQGFEVVVRAPVDEAPGGLASKVRRAAEEDES